jgi:hypothetical protein
MHLSRMKLRAQQGFTTVTLMGVLAVGGLLVAAGFAAVDPDISLSREDQDYKQAYGAAESGLQWYLNALGTNNNYYVTCNAGLPEPSPGQPAPVNQQWDGTGTDPRIWRNIPGEEASYTVELLPAPGRAECVPNDQYSMVDPNGNMRLRVTGRSRGETRSVLATLRRRNFIDFVYFTNYETLDPAAYANPASAEASCARYRAGRSSGCTEIRFTDVDDQLGPVHTNDNFLICGSPQFGRTQRDRVEASSGSSMFVEACPSSPDVRGTPEHPSAPLGLPPSNTAISQVAEADYRFQGRTTIVLQGANMLVTNRQRFPDGLAHTMALPDNGVIWVEGTPAGTCTATYDRSQDYSFDTTPCGDVWVSGTYGRDLTIAASNDVIIDGHLEKGDDGLLLGLIANNFVRVYHPVSDDCATNLTGSISDLRLAAAILALNHSFIVDNWGCGTPLGDLIVDGAIAQRFRGPVGTVSGLSIASGYRKDYEYNDRLRYREPPFFLDPVQASWRVARQNEQVPATGAAPG